VYNLRSICGYVTIMFAYDLRRFNAFWIHTTENKK